MAKTDFCPSNGEGKPTTTLLSLQPPLFDCQNLKLKDNGAMNVELRG
jgi:hypothetical protein